MRLYRPCEAAGVLDCSEMHVYRLIASGQLRAVDISQEGSRRPKTRVRSDDMEAYIDKRTRGRPTSRPAA